MHQMLFNAVDMKKKNCEKHLLLHFNKKNVFNDDYHHIIKEDKSEKHIKKLIRMSSKIKSTY